MKIALFQSDIVWGDPEANRQALLEKMRMAPEADLYVLPEMFTTGFATEPEGIAEEAPCRTLDFLKELSAGYDAAFAGSVAIHEDGKYFNRFYFVKPDGTFASYDKHHLFTFGGEDRTYTAGKNTVVLEWRGVRFILLICYDLRFPVFSRNQGDYDAIIYVASWPTVRRYAWDTLVRARAIENQCYVAAVNRTGNDPACSYNGGTALIDPYGKVVASCPDGIEGFVTAEIDMDALEQFREKFPVLSDADDFTIHY